MKKLFLIGALALAGVINAQTAKGGWVIDAKSNLGFNSFSMSSDGKEEAKVSAFHIASSLGYFVADNFSVGAELGYGTIKLKDTSSSALSDVNFSIVSVVPNATYYFGSTEFRPYLNGGIGYSAAFLKDESKGGLTWNAKGGVVYLINNNVGLNAGVGYRQLMLKEENTNMNFSNLSVTGGVSVFL